MPTNYEQYWNCSTRRKGYSGTALLTRIKPQRVWFGMGVQKHDEEGRVVTAEYSKFVLVTTYFPNSGFFFVKLDNRLHWDANFGAYLNHLRDTIKKPVILGGDMNIGRDELDIYE